MNLPNQELMARYDTTAVYAEKLAGNLPIAARIAAGIIGAGFASHLHHEQEKQNLQAEMMNDQFRALLGQQMEQATSSIQHTRVPMLLPAGTDIPLGMTDGMVRLAAASGQEIAHAELEKEAGVGTPIAAIGKGLWGGIKGMSNGFDAAAKASRSTFTGSMRAGFNRGLGAFKNEFNATMSAAKPLNADQYMKLNPHRRESVARIGRLSPKGVTQQAVKSRNVAFTTNPLEGRAAQSEALYGRVSQSRSSRQMRYSKPAGGAPVQKPVQPGQTASTAPAPKQPAPAAATPQTQPAQTPQPTPAQPQAPAAADAAGAKAPGTLDRLKGEMGNGGWKWKAPAIGAMALGGYGMYRMGQGAFNWLGKEPGTARFNAGGASPAAAVNQYGVPDGSAPFGY